MAKIQATLNKGMEEILMECHEREIMNQKPLTGAAKFIKHLHIRGFVASRPIEGTSHMGFYITEEGKRYLEEKCGG
jgi:hypothetical protein